MQSPLLKAAIVIAALCAQACIYVSSDGESDGLSGDVVTRSSRPSAFDQLAVNGSFRKVTVEICDCEPLVRVRGDERLVEEVTIHVENDVLGRS